MVLVEQRLDAVVADLGGIAPSHDLVAKADGLCLQYLDQRKANANTMNDLEFEIRTRSGRRGITRQRQIRSAL